MMPTLPPLAAPQVVVIMVMATCSATTGDKFGFKNFGTSVSDSCHDANFVVTWDTAGCHSGNHLVKVIVTVPTFRQTDNIMAASEYYRDFRTLVSSPRPQRINVVS